MSYRIDIEILLSFILAKIRQLFINSNVLIFLVNLEYIPISLALIALNGYAI
jgi:hypothetical protein